MYFFICQLVSTQSCFHHIYNRQLSQVLQKTTSCRDILTPTLETFIKFTRQSALIGAKHAPSMKNQETRKNNQI